MKKLLFILSLILPTVSFSQVSVNKGIYFAKEFSKEISLYRAKTFVMNEILGIEEKLTKFEIDPLAASSSGELTTLVYNCEEKKMSGLVLGFYGDRWNDSGVSFQAYAFKNLPKKKALEILSTIEKFIADESKFLSQDYDNNNMFFKFDDITFLIYKTTGGSKIRVFWNGFDSEWESTAFGRTKKRFEKSID
ncbi:hypothetical protein [Polaribacter sp.]|uniref:hypothetical protein n=1 Tax=Polaribacter sp. TaxID=1920175 RepID=UPI004047431B